MARRTKNLEMWCHENNQERLLQEWDEEVNNKMRLPESPKTIEYNSPRAVYWKCNVGHKWKSPVAVRTLFGRECPVCDEKMAALPVGTKYGCLTIIGDYSIYEKEIAEVEIAKLEKKKEAFLQGKRDPWSNVDSVDSYDHWIEEYKNRKYYQCQCKCGMKQFLSEFDLLKKKRRYCTDIENHNIMYQSADYPTITECGLKSKQKEKRLASFKRVLDKNYNVDFVHTFHESLEVLECIDEHYEKLTSYGDRRKKDGGIYTVYKVYKCRCYLCGKVKNINCSQFYINPPTEYGSTAYNGYYSGAYCDCHKISSFQWIVNKVLMENNVPYRVEWSFPDLYGVGNKNLLRYDFAVLHSDGTVKCLIECQGEQHYKPVDEFGGISQFRTQRKNDELKRQYAEKKRITLLEIPYKNKKIEKVEEFLREQSII